MKNKTTKDYPDITHISRENLDANDSLVKMLTMVGKSKRVVDFGCATGYFAKLLSQEGCEVVGVEINPDAAKIAEQYCKRVVVADLDNIDLTTILGDDKFEVATFGDVLEHLKDPWTFLSTVKKILTPNGYVVASVPNVAHGSVRLALAEGRFEYTELGLLDSTHIRFFTYESLHHLFESSGYGIESEDAVTFPLFSDSPLTPNLDRENFPNELLTFIDKDKHSEALQFVVRAYPWSMSYKYRLLKNENNQSKKDAAAAQAKLSQAQVELQQTQLLLQQTQAELRERTLTIQTMTNSRAWRIGQQWYKVKNLLRNTERDR